MTLASAALTSFGLLAGIPEEPEIARIGLAAVGYIFFVFLFRSALRVWRSDWSDLWGPPIGRSRDRSDPRETQPLPFRARSRVTSFFLLFGVVTMARSQQTIDSFARFGTGVDVYVIETAD